MRTLLPLVLLLVAAKGGKKKDEVPPPPAAEPAPAPAEEAPPAPAEPAPPPEPVRVRNADLTISVGFSDGRVKTGHVTGIERSSDFYAEEGWTTDEGKLKLTVESGSSEKQVIWKDVKSVAITPGKIPDDVDCTYSSDFTPWMYECTLRTTVTVSLKDGSKGIVTARHKWRFTWEDGSKEEFWLYKHVAREQDDRDVHFGDEVSENFALYTRLQDRLRTEIKTLVKSVSVS